MMRTNNSNDRSVFTGLVLAFALFGLFFSNAEGITLLPFPDRTANEQAGFGHSRTQSRYHQTLTSARTAPAKRSPSNTTFDGVAGPPALSHLQPTRAIVAPIDVTPERASEPYTDASVGTIRGRAPPLA